MKIFRSDLMPHIFVHGTVGLFIKGWVLLIFIDFLAIFRS